VRAARGHPSEREEQRAKVAGGPHKHGPPGGRVKSRHGRGSGVQARAGETNWPGTVQSMVPSDGSISDRTSGHQQFSYSLLR
jgi:hypothetical protein